MMYPKEPGLQFSVYAALHKGLSCVFHDDTIMRLQLSMLKNSEVSCVLSQLHKSASAGLFVVIFILCFSHSGKGFYNGCWGMA